jgi:tRNA-dihydrouridine synthase A
MARPQVVADCFRAMQSAVDVPVTVKTRIGIDDQDNYDFFRRFVDVVAGAGCTTFIVHARIAVLEGLSPKENRSIPPLNYPRVRKLKTDMPELRIVLNGGITSAAQVREHLECFDGVMIGRQAYHEPWLLHQLDVQYGSHADPDRRRSDVVRGMYPYIERQLSAGARLNHITRHMLALYAGQPGARAWRRYISEHAHLPGAGVEVLESALGALPAAA